jgi:Kazal-type serine protease inhibitor domain
MNPSVFNKLFLTFLALAAPLAQADVGICTREYAPICGQLHKKTQTFANRCVMKNAKAKWVSDGECPHVQAPQRKKPAD